jgi:hypothetical protein
MCIFFKQLDDSLAPGDGVVQVIDNVAAGDDAA